MSDKRDDKNCSSNSGLVLPPDVIKAGTLRKLKTMKKKFFILRAESESGPARLEYYDNEKKFKSGGSAKRSIPLGTCFSINRKVDAKHKLAIALYTNDDCFAIVADNEESYQEWFNIMLELQLNGTYFNGGAKLKPKFDHVWQVNVGEKSLASSRNMKGPYRLCLTSSSLSLIKMDQSDRPETLEFPLMSIRRCGHTNNYFVIELGRSSVIGAGELWLETEDGVIAQNMHEVTLSAMKSCREHEDLGPLTRPRSASNSENSRPIATRRPVAVVSPQTISYGGIRDRCDSMPSRPRTISEGQEINNRSYYAPPGFILDSLRPHSGYTRTTSYSPPSLNNPLSPMSANASTDSAGSSLSIDEFDAGQQSDFAHGRYGHSLPTDGALHTEPPITEEQYDDYIPMSTGSHRSTNGYLHMAPLSVSAPNGPGLYLNLSSSTSTNTSTNTTQSNNPPVSQHNEYVEMRSPTEGYINMSPVGATTELRSNKSCSALDSSVNDSSQNKDGYIHMAPLNNQFSSASCHDGYLEMAPLSSSLPKTLSTIPNHNSGMSSRVDSRTDTLSSSPGATNLQDFPLDKVKSLLTDTEETSTDYIRPVRAYSMGSRPQPKKSHLPIQVDGSRIRAYSVGSQAASQRKVNNPVDRELGSLMRMDPRSGAKSSSAPLLNNRPPRIRSSTSRGDVGEDLMEIDYNKSRYSSSGFDLCDSNFTIEPVGRSRSGSYSSSNTSVKLLHDQDKAKSSHSGLNTSISRDNSITNDYLTMSPLNEHGKAISKISTIGIPPKSDYSNTVPKRIDPIHPPGDYVSLDPSSTYQSATNSQTNNFTKPNSASNVNENKTASCRSYNGVRNLNSNILASLHGNDNFDGNIRLENNVTINDIRNRADSPDYMCMDFTQNTQVKTFVTDGSLEISTNNHSTIPKKYSPELNLTNKVENSSKRKDMRRNNSLQSFQQMKEASHPSSPNSKSPSPHMSPSSSDNIVPKTPPPSPYYGAISSALSGAPLMEKLVRRLSQPSGASATNSAPNSRPSSVCGGLNYASLDLPPASEEDKGATGRLRKPPDDDTKGAPLTYAEIDFSPMRKKNFPDSDNSSHL